MTIEDKFVEEITELLKKRISTDGSLFTPKIKVDHHINILKDITAIPNSIKSYKWELVFGDAEQDIVVYLDENEKKLRNFRIEIPFSGDLVKARKSFPPKSKRNHFPYCVIPYIIWEVKVGDVISHKITQYSSMAQQIKDKFPHVMYNLLMIGSTKLDETVLRHGKNFDLITTVKRGTPLENIAEKLYEIVKDRMSYAGILKNPEKR